MVKMTKMAGCLRNTLIVIFLTTASPAFCMNIATPTVQADYLWSQGYQGSGVEIAIIDTQQADADHPAISGNYLGSINFAKPPTLQDNHATQVAGAAVGQDPSYPGIAPQTQWWTGQTANRFDMSSVRTQTVAAETFGQGLGALNGDPVEVMTLSISFAYDSDGMDQWSLALDHIANTNGTVITVAAGNDGPADGSVTGSPPGAYNVITVGATGGTLGYISEDYQNVVYYSSRGPTYDGRAKPDIVAPGSLLRLPLDGGGWSDSSSGTSFATPIVAGGAALLVGMGRELGFSTDPKVVKSVLLNSADKLDGWANSPTQPLDYNQGAGQMDLRKAYDQYSPGESNPGTVSAVGWDREDITDAQENLYFLDMPAGDGDILTATLVWDRLVTTNTEDINTAVYDVDRFSNLDLFLYDVNDLATPLVLSASTVDNVEHLYYEFSQGGRYVLGIQMTDADVGDWETYALSWDLTVFRIMGDADGSGYVDDDDLSLLLSSWGMVADWANGEFSGAGTVDDDDLSLLLNNWHAGTPPVGTLIPEPAALSLLVLGASVSLRLRRKAGRMRH